jgi:hypothetical protein
VQITRNAENLEEFFTSPYYYDVLKIYKEDIVGLLYELLAVEKDAKEVFAKIIDETSKTFNQRSSHFVESRKSYLPFNDEDNDRPDEEFTPMVTTVKDKLDYAQGAIIRFMDIELQKEQANQNARADVMVEKADGSMETILKDAPVTFLVQMESVLERLRKAYGEIPTIDPSKVWTVDPTREGVWKSEPVQRVRTKKVPRVITKAEATDKFQAQADIIMLDEAVGTWTQVFASGGLSPKQKSQLLGRIDRLVAGIKIARAKANAQEIKDSRVGQAFFNYINEGFKI